MLTGVHNETNMSIIMQADRPLLVEYSRHLDPDSPQHPLKHHHTAVPVALWVYRAGLEAASVAKAHKQLKVRNS